MKNPGPKPNVFEAGPSMRALAPYTNRMREVLEGIPSVRREKVARMQRLVASGNWPPRNDALVDRLLLEHLLGPLHT